MRKPKAHYSIEPVAPDLQRSLREHVHERLRDAIVAGRFRKGERLNERNLADTLGVSTTPVKEAILRLEYEGLVRTESRRGVFVEFSARAALEMALSRATLESAVTHIAANHLSDCDAAELALLVARMEEATEYGNLEDLVARNEAFHRAIHRISGCTYLERRLGDERKCDHAQRIAMNSEPAERLRGFEEHRGIYEALIAREAPLAELRMRRHIVRSATAHIRLVFGEATEALHYEE